MDHICCVNHLPNSCLLRIFKFLQSSELANISVTCKRFYDLVYYSRSVFRLLDFRCYEDKITSIPFEGIWMNVKYVRFLSLRFCINISNFSVLNEMEQLERLDVFCTNVKDSDLCCFTYKLRAIDIGYCPFISSKGLLHFLLQRSSRLQIIGLAALEKAVIDEVNYPKTEFYFIQFIDYRASRI